MAYQDGYPARRTSSLAILLTSRDTVPVATAAAGTLLLTTALAQPLTPRLPNFEFSYSSAPAMSHVWQAIIIAVLVAGAAGALLWNWRHILGLGTVLICGISAAALLINLLVLNPAVSVLDLMTDRGNWALYATLFVPPFLRAARRSCKRSRAPPASARASDGANAQAAAEEAATELAAEEPDTSRVRRLLDKVAAAAGPVAETAAAVNAVQRAITGGW